MSTTMWCKQCNNDVLNLSEEGTIFCIKCKSEKITNVNPHQDYVDPSGHRFFNGQLLRDNELYVKGSAALEKIPESGKMYT